MEKRPVQLLLDADILDALDRFGQSQGIPRDALIVEACRHYLAQLSSPRPRPLAETGRPQLELELLERQKEAVEAERNLLILQYERAISEYPLKDPAALEWDIHRLGRDIARLRAQIAAKRLELLGEERGQ